MRDFKLRRRFNKLVKDGGAGGGAGGAMRIERNKATNALDKTWQEISDCFGNGGYAYVGDSPIPTLTIIMPIMAIGQAGDAEYFVDALLANSKGAQAITFTCSSPDEYPTSADASNT